MINKKEVKIATEVKAKVAEQTTKVVAPPIQKAVVSAPNPNKEKVNLCIEFLGKALHGGITRGDISYLKGVLESIDL